jgi:hypothetical protein
LGLVVAVSLVGQRAQRSAASPVIMHRPHQVPYSIWQQPGGSGLHGVGSWFHEPLIDFPEGRSYAFGHTFSFLGKAPGGILALTDEPGGRFAVLGLFTDAGLERLVVPFPWTDGRFYFPLVALVGDHVGGWVFDQTAGTWALVAAFAVDPGWGLLSPVSTTWVAWTGGIRPCERYPPTSSVRFPPVGIGPDSALTVAVGPVDGVVGSPDSHCPARIIVYDAGRVAYGLGHAGTGIA